jgi:hypothetical protein
MTCEPLPHASQPNCIHYFDHSAMWASTPTVDCFKCAPGYYLTSKLKCQASCPSDEMAVKDYYYRIGGTQMKGDVCRRYDTTDTGCKEFYRYGYSNCKRCKDGYQMVQLVGQVVGRCQRCHPSCKSCLGPTKYECSQCYGASYLLAG